MTQAILERALQSKLQQLQEKFALISMSYTAKCQLLQKKQIIIDQLHQKIKKLQQELSMKKQGIEQLQSQKELLADLGANSNIIPEFCSWQSENYKSQLKKKKIAIQEPTLLFDDKKYENQLKTQPKQQNNQKLSFPSIMQVPQQNQQNLKIQKLEDEPTSDDFKISPEMKCLKGKPSQVEIRSCKDLDETEKLKELHKIWEQRDQELGKMDQLFETLKERLKDYE